ncbi:MAG TPA: Trm112 family protein [Longimicrobium sp.]|nr:Trm112 family protein [Longimicrobium sp.]
MTVERDERTMHILLTDVLTCPRCGPELGLILLADRIDGRRVVEGRLGCANCREQYPIRGGAVDLRVSGAAHPGVGGSDRGGTEDPQEAAVRLAALLGLADAQGTVLVAGPGAALAGDLAALVPELEVVALAPEPGDLDGRAGVTPMAGTTAPLPFRAGKLRGVALTDGADEAALSEGLRVLQPGARLVVENAAQGTGEALARLGAQVILEQEGTVVARAVGQPVQLRMNASR